VLLLQSDDPPVKVPSTRPELLKTGEPEEPPSVTPCPFVVPAQYVLQWAFGAPTEPPLPFQVVDVKEELYVDIFLISPAGWCIPTPLELDDPDLSQPL